MLPVVAPIRFKKDVLMADAFLIAHRLHSYINPKLVPVDPDEELKKLILKTIVDLVSDFIYHDRKEDEELPQGAIENAVEHGVITHTEMMAKFYEEIRNG